MKAKCFLIILIGIGFFSLILLGPLSVHAALYNTDLGFNTSDQNMWGGETAIVSENAYSLGYGWNKSVNLGGTYDVKVPGGCLPWPLNSVCWNPYSLGETGAELKANTNGYVGIEAGYKIDSGSINASYQADLVLTYPDPGTIKPGDTFTISSEVVNPNAGFNTNFPEIQAYVDLIFDVYADLYAKAVVLDVGPVIDVTLIDVEKTYEIVGFNRDEDGNVSVFGTDYGFGEEIELGDYADITVTIPKINTDSTDESPNTESKGDTNFLEFGIDVDTVLTQLAYAAAGMVDTPENPLPPSIFAGDILDVITYDILDVDVGAELDIVQKFAWVPELWISLSTSDGFVSDEFKAGNSIDLVMGESVLDITPTFTLKGDFSNWTALKIVPEIELALLSASAFGLGFDYLYEKQFQLDLGDSLSIPVYNKDFPLGFDSYPGASFSVSPAVPEPSTLLLLGSGLIGLAGLVRRKKRKIN